MKPTVQKKIHQRPPGTNRPATAPGLRIARTGLVMFNRFCHEMMAGYRYAVLVWGEPDPGQDEVEFQLTLIETPEEWPVRVQTEDGEIHALHEKDCVRLERPGPKAKVPGVAVSLAPELKRLHFHVPADVKSLPFPCTLDPENLTLSWWLPVNNRPVVQEKPAVKRKGTLVKVV